MSETGATPEEIIADLGEQVLHLEAEIEERDNAIKKLKTRVLVQPLKNLVGEAEEMLRASLVEDVKRITALAESAESRVKDLEARLAKSEAKHQEYIETRDWQEAHNDNELVLAINRVQKLREESDAVAGAMRYALGLVRRTIAIESQTTLAVMDKALASDAGAAFLVERERLLAVERAAMMAKEYLKPNLVEPGRTVFWALSSALSREL